MSPVSETHAPAGFKAEGSVCPDAANLREVELRHRGKKTMSFVLCGSGFTVSCCRTQGR